MTALYKIMSADDWAEAQRAGKVAPAPVDVRDGYIHLSTEDQVLETARLHFAGRTDLVAAEFAAEDFGAALKWEASRGGALFPHLYADLLAAKARGARRLIRSADGSFAFGGGAL
ncbi:MAG: DUF952 domain-containing protein [Pseudomonadota bacterium]